MTVWPRSLVVKFFPPPKKWKLRGQRATLPPSHSRFFYTPLPLLPLPIPSVSPPFTIFFVGRHGNKSTRRGGGGGEISIMGAATGLVASRGVGCSQMERFMHSETEGALEQKSRREEVRQGGGGGIWQIEEKGEREGDSTCFLAHF